MPSLLETKVPTYIFNVILHTDEEELTHHPKFNINYYFRQGFVSMSPYISGDAQTSACGVAIRSGSAHLALSSQSNQKANMYYAGSVVITTSTTLTCTAVLYDASAV